jgi:hypothetical protein
VGYVWSERLCGTERTGLLKHTLRWRIARLAGLMYGMVAIGFVLIYKASGVFNFAQGTMVFFAAPPAARPATH